jgi:hypothetical protein
VTQTIRIIGNKERSRESGELRLKKIRKGKPEKRNAYCGHRKGTITLTVAIAKCSNPDIQGMGAATLINIRIWVPGIQGPYKRCNRGCYLLLLVIVCCCFS